MPSLQFNYASAFAMYEQGHTLDQISQVTGIPIKTLKTQHSLQGWQGLKASMKSFHDAQRELAPLTPTVDHALALKRLETNRDANYTQAKQLFDLTQKTIDTWIKAATIPNEEGRTFAPSPKDLKELANAVATIHELTYRALGDGTAAKKDPSFPADKQTPQVIINLPGVLASPRIAKKTIDVPSEQSSTQSAP